MLKYVVRKLNELQLLLTSECICVFRKVVTVNSYYFPEQHYRVGWQNGEAVHLYSRDAWFDFHPGHRLS
jgi:hypothetical protein